MTVRIRRFANRAELDAALVRRLETVITAAAGAPTALMLSGGKTPLPAYTELARRRPQAAEQLCLLYSDERYLPASSPDSNYHGSRALLDALALPQSSVLRVRTELPLTAAVADYEQRIAELLRSGAHLALGLLGLGPDGHTASLFSAADLERARGRLAIGVQRPDGMQGITVTPQFLTHFAELLVPVTGGGKYDAIRRFIGADPQLIAFAAVRDCPAVELWVEQAAEWSVYA